MSEVPLCYPYYQDRFSGFSVLARTVIAVSVFVRRLLERGADTVCTRSVLVVLVFVRGRFSAQGVCHIFTSNT